MFDVLGNISSVNTLMKDYKNMNEHLDVFTKTTNVKRGEDWVKEYLKKTA